MTYRYFGGIYTSRPNQEVYRKSGDHYEFMHRSRYRSYGGAHWGYFVPSGEQLYPIPDTTILLMGFLE